jgi:plasmid stabilization system protein ParE
MAEPTTTPAKETTAAAPEAGAAAAPAATTQDPKSTTPPAKAEGEKSTTETPKTEEGKKPESFLDASKTDPEKKPDESPKGEETPAFKLPEGVKADEPLVAAFTSTVKDLKLSGEAAQKLVDAYAGVIAEQNKAAQEAWAKTLADNRKALEAHPEIGGTHLEKSQAEARKAIVFLDQQHGGLGSRVVGKLSQLGLGDDPDLAHFLTLAGRSMAEDRTGDRSTPSTPNQTSEEARMAKRYPTIKGIQSGKSGG